ATAPSRAGRWCTRPSATATSWTGTAAAATCPTATARCPAAATEPHPRRARRPQRMTQWYYSDDERNRHGPVGDADMAGLHADGQLGPDTLVWREGLAQWQPWRSVMHEVVAPAAPAPAAAGVAASTAEGYDPYAVAEPGSPYAPPRAPVQHVPDVHLDGHVVYAGFWKRVAAYLIDTVIVGILGAMLGAAIGGLLGAAFGIGG